jgi:dihydroxy-acid dehydratase
VEVCISKNGDTITIDAVKNTINLKISDEEFAEERQIGYKPESKKKKRSITDIVSFINWVCNR